MSNISFKIKDLRQQSMIATVEAILVVIGALFSIAILPTLLLRYFYADQQLFEQPKLLEYLPVAATLLAIIYFLKAMFGNMRRDRKVKQLTMEMEMMGDDCCGSCGPKSMDSEADEDWDEDLKELEELLAEVEKEEAKAKSKSSSKSSSKKSATKKKSSKKSSKK